MNKRGFTFIEILIVMVIIGVIASFGIPRIRDSMLKVNIRSARVGFSLLAVTARQAAVARGCYGVSIASTVDSIQYDPRGISIGYTRAVVTFTASGTSYSDSAVVNAIGKV